MHHNDKAEDSTSKGKKYVILNAALDTSTVKGRVISTLYRCAQFLGRSKLRDAPIIDIYNRPFYENLTAQQKRALAEADNIIILGHCDEGERRLYSSSGSSIDVNSVVGILNQGIKSTANKKVKISVIACKSLAFGRALAESCNNYSNLDGVQITARRYEVSPMPFSGKKYNRVTEGNKEHYYHRGPKNQPYKTRFTLHHNATIGQEQVVREGKKISPVKRNFGF